jgi:hypothetical protein
MHKRYARAAVDVDVEVEVGVDAKTAPRSRLPAPPDHPRSRAASPTTLWATRPLSVASGRLVGVRLRGESIVEVAVVSSHGEHLRWVLATSALTHGQAIRWTRSSRFRP